MYKVKFYEITKEGEIIRSLGETFSRKTDTFDQIKDALNKHYKKAFLDLPYERIDADIRSVGSCNGRWTNFEDYKDRKLYKAKYFDPENGDWKELDMYIGVIIYSYGYVIKTNKQSQTIFGPSNKKSLYLQIYKN